MNDAIEPEDEEMDADEGPLGVDEVMGLPMGEALAYFDKWKDNDEDE